MIKQVFAFFKGFKYATNGIFIAVKQERNLRFDIVFAILVYFFSSFYNFSSVEYILITLFVAGIFSLELVNSAIERAVAKPDENHYNFAGAAKDIAAGAVLIFAIASGIVGIILFWDKAVLFNIFNFFTQKIWALGLLVLFLIVSFLFVFRNEDNSIGK